MATFHRVRRPAVAALMCLSLLAGCQTNRDTAQVLGTVGGAAVGGIIGSRFGGGAGKVVATAFGTVVGGVIGNQLAAYLSESDQQTAQAAVVQTASTGQSIRWNGEGNKVSGQTKVVQKTTEKRTPAIPVYRERVKVTPALDLVGETYTAKAKTAKAKTAVRGGPANNYVQVDSLGGGDSVTVVGTVKGNSGWAMVSDGKAASGFVPMASLKPVVGTAVAQAPVKPVASGGAVETANIDADSDCKTIQQTIVLAGGEKKSDTVTVCRGPEGWTPKA